MPIMSHHSLKRKLYALFFASPPCFPPLPLRPRELTAVSPWYSDPPTGLSKKAKKNQANKSSTVLALDVGDRATLNRRAERFRREHELEKQKQNGGGQASSLRANNPRTAHPLVNLSRSATPFANADDPEADPVRTAPLLDSPALSSSCGCDDSWCRRHLQNVPNWDQHTIVGVSQEIFKDYLRLTSVRIAIYPSGLSEFSLWILGPKARTNTSVPRSSANANRTQEAMAREGPL
jgi:hypothetical protein